MNSRWPVVARMVISTNMILLNLFRMVARLSYKLQILKAQQIGDYPEYKQFSCIEYLFGIGCVHITYIILTTYKKFSVYIVCILKHFESWLASLMVVRALNEGFVCKKLSVVDQVKKPRRSRMLNSNLTKTRND